MLKNESRRRIFRSGLLIKSSLKGPPTEKRKLLQTANPIYPDLYKVTIRGQITGQLGFWSSKSLAIKRRVILGFYRSRFYELWVPHYTFNFDYLHLLAALAMCARTAKMISLELNISLKSSKLPTQSPFIGARTRKRRKF